AERAEGPDDQVGAASAAVARAHVRGDADDHLHAPGQAEPESDPRRLTRRQPERVLLEVEQGDAGDHARPEAEGGEKNPGVVDAEAAEPPSKRRAHDFHPTTEFLRRPAW